MVSKEKWEVGGIMKLMMGKKMKLIIWTLEVESKPVYNQL